MSSFDEWNKQKKKLNNDDVSVERFFHYRDVWWCKLGKNVGFEQDGKGGEYVRPVLVLRALGKDTLLVAPLTTSKDKHFFRISVGKVDGKDAKAIISQIRTVDARRLLVRIDVVSYDRMNNLKKAIKNLF